MDSAPSVPEGLRDVFMLGSLGAWKSPEEPTLYGIMAESLDLLEWSQGQRLVAFKRPGRTNITKIVPCIKLTTCNNDVLRVMKYAALQIYCFAKETSVPAGGLRDEDLDPDLVQKAAKWADWQIKFLLDFLKEQKDRDLSKNQDVREKLASNLIFAALCLTLMDDIPTRKDNKPLFLRVSDSASLELPEKAVTTLSECNHFSKHGNFYTADETMRIDSFTGIAKEVLVDIAEGEQNLKRLEKQQMKALHSKIYKYIKKNKAFGRILSDSAGNYIILDAECSKNLARRKVKLNEPISERFLEEEHQLDAGKDYFYYFYSQYGVLQRLHCLKQQKNKEAVVQRKELAVLGENEEDEKQQEEHLVHSGDDNDAASSAGFGGNEKDERQQDQQLVNNDVDENTTSAELGGNNKEDEKQQDQQLVNNGVDDDENNDATTTSVHLGGNNEEDEKQQEQHVVNSGVDDNDAAAGARPDSTTDSQQEQPTTAAEVLNEENIANDTTTSAAGFGAINNNNSAKQPQLLKEDQQQQQKLHPAASKDAALAKEATTAHNTLGRAKAKVPTQSQTTKDATVQEMEAAQQQQQQQKEQQAASIRGKEVTTDDEKKK